MMVFEELKYTECNSFSSIIYSKEIGISLFLFLIFLLCFGVSYLLSMVFFSRLREL